MPTNELISFTKKWMQLEQEIARLHEHISKLREEKDKMEQKTIQLLNAEGLSNTALGFQTCRIYLGNEKCYKPANYTQRFIEEQLEKIIPKEQVKMICQHLKSGRVVENKKILKKAKNKIQK